MHERKGTGVNTRIMSGYCSKNRAYLFELVEHLGVVISQAKESQYMLWKQHDSYSTENAKQKHHNIAPPLKHAGWA